MDAVLATAYSLRFHESIPRREAGKPVGRIVEELGALRAAAIELFECVERGGGEGEVECLRERECLSEFLSVRDLRLLKLKVKSRFEGLANVAVNLCSVLKAMGGDEVKIEGFVKRVEKEREIFEGFFGALKSVAVLEDMDGVALLREAAKVTVHDLQIRLGHESKRLEDGQYANHVCIVCRRFPAVSFMVPCGHAALCSHCEKELVSTNSLFERCYFCQERVKSLESLKFVVTCTDV